MSIKKHLLVLSLKDLSIDRKIIYKRQLNLWYSNDLH